MKYTCAHCKKDFIGRAIEKAEAEAKEIWGVEKASSDPRMVVVCNSCYQTMHPALHPDLVKRAKREL